jgi:hypothetical protein
LALDEVRLALDEVRMALDEASIYYYVHVELLVFPTTRCLYIGHI